MKTPRSGCPVQLEVCLEARHLPPVGVAVDLEVDEVEMVSVEQDHPGAGPEDRAAEPANRLLEPVQPHQAGDRRRLAAGDDEPVEPVELLGQAHLDRLRAEAAQHRRVLAEVALDCEDADLHAVDSRRASHALVQRGASARCRTSRPRLDGRAWSRTSARKSPRQR